MSDRRLYRRYPGRRPQSDVVGVIASMLLAVALISVQSCLPSNKSAVVDRSHHVRAPIPVAARAEPDG